jgi:serine/threonine protein kinase
MKGTTMTSSIGTINYCSPEVMNNKVFTEKCDVYSFGIIMYEVFFEVVPYLEREQDSIIILVFEVIKGARPTYPERKYSNDERMYLQLMERCWSAVPEDRPMFTEILNKFEQISNV